MVVSRKTGHYRNAVLVPAANHRRQLPQLRLFTAAASSTLTSMKRAIGKEDFSSLLGKDGIFVGRVRRIASPGQRQ